MPWEITCVLNLEMHSCMDAVLLMKATSLSLKVLIIPYKVGILLKDPKRLLGDICLSKSKMGIPPFHHAKACEWVWARQMIHSFRKCAYTYWSGFVIGHLFNLKVTTKPSYDGMFKLSFTSKYFGLTFQLMRQNLKLFILGLQSYFSYCLHFFANHCHWLVPCLMLKLDDWISPSSCPFIVVVKWLGLSTYLILLYVGITSILISFG